MKEERATPHEAELLEALRASEARKAAILEAALDAIITIDHEGRVIEFNAAAERLFGYAREAVVGRSLAELIVPPRLRDAHRQGLARFLATSEGPVLGTRSEMPAMRSDGSEFPVELGIALIPTDGPPIFTAYVRDITERKLVERRRSARQAISLALAASGSVEEAAETVLQAIGETLGWEIGALWSVDPHADVLRCLQVWHSPSLEANAWESRTRRAIFAPGVGLPGRIWTSGEPIWIPDALQDPQFTRAAVAAQVGLHGACYFPIQLGNAILGVVEFFSHEIRPLDDDMLEIMSTNGAQIGQLLLRRQVEEALSQQTRELAHSVAELEQFVYVASHDLQEPLRMVASFSQLLARRYQGQLGADADDFIGYIVDGANRMQRLINDLLTYSRVGGLASRLAVTDCTAVFEAACANLRAAIEECQATVTSDPLPTLLADEGQLVQLFQNLIGNAIKFRGARAVEVHVGAERQGDEWLFRVRDNGIGIDAQYADRIFLMFQRLHSGSEFAGTGIGLAICRKIVERHEGRIWVESEPGEGSTFYFTLPASGEGLP